MLRGALFRWRDELNRLVVLVLCGSLSAACSRGQAPRCADAPTFAFSKLQVDRAPPARFDHAMAVDRDGKRIFLFGGRDGSRFFSDLWVFDAVRASWERLETSSGPPPRSGHSLVFHAATDTLVLFGGYRHTRMGEPVFLRELWIFRQDEGWRREFFRFGPPGRAWHAALSAGDAMLVFGGFAAAAPYHLNDVWELDLGEMTFKRLATDGGPKMSGPPAGLQVDGGKAFVLFGKEGIPRPTRTGIWCLDVEQDRWTTVAEDDPPAADYTLATASRFDQSLLALREPREGARGWHIWIRLRDDRSWCEQRLDNGPEFGHGMRCAADPVRRLAWICYGGVRRNRLLDGTWLLTPER